MTVREINSMPFVFIVGMGRSGTTLLRTILDAGEEAIFTPEAKIIVHLKQKYHLEKNWTENRIDEFLNDLYTEVKFVKIWKIQKDELKTKIVAYPSNELSFSFIIRLIYLSFPSNFEKTKIKLIGDKNPVHSIFIKELLEVFPNALFIHIVRDYRDCILSNKKLFKRKNVAPLAKLWVLYNLWIEVYKKKYPLQFFYLRYEELTAEPEKTVSEICKFTGLTFHPKMLNYHHTLSEKIDSDINRVVQHTHPNLLKGVTTESIGKWKNELSHAEMDVIAYLTKDVCGKYGYEQYEAYSGKKYYLKSMVSFWVNCKDIFITKGYFLLPFSVRNAIRKLTRFIFNKTGYFTVYNQGDFLFEVVEKKRREEKNNLE